MDEIIEYTDTLRQLHRDETSIFSTIPFDIIGIVSGYLIPTIYIHNGIPKIRKDGWYIRYHYHTWTTCIESAVKIINGLKTGKEYVWYTYGDPSYTIEYENDLKNGITLDWCGHQVGRVLYSKGKCISGIRYNRSAYDMEFQRAKLFHEQLEALPKIDLRIKE